jgi:hypothetical protein
MMGVNERTKWIGFYKLRDALAQPGCAVCRVVTDSCRRILGDLFHEFVNDPTTRSWLQDANGFCNWHAWMAVQLPDPSSGLATIYETILVAMLNRFARLEERSAAPQHGNGILGLLLGSEHSTSPRLLERAGECQICRRAEENEASCLEELITWIDDEEMRAAFDASFGLCLPHLDLLIARFDGHENLATLIELERRKCETLLEELREYLRKLDYRYADEPFGDEQDSWRRVVELLVGKARLFPIQMRRDG